jgi:hypothetical protein
MTRSCPRRRRRLGLAFQLGSLSVPSRRAGPWHNSPEPCRSGAQPQHRASNAVLQASGRCGTPGQPNHDTHGQARECRPWRRHARAGRGWFEVFIARPTTPESSAEQGFTRAVLKLVPTLEERKTGAWNTARAREATPHHERPSRSQPIKPAQYQPLVARQ